VCGLSQVNQLFETDTFDAGGAELATIDLLPRHLSKPCLLNKEPPPVPEAEFQEWVLNGEKWTGERLREMAMEALRACRGVFKDAWDAELKSNTQGDYTILSGDTVVNVLQRMKKRVHFNLTVQRIVYNKNERDKKAAKRAEAARPGAENGAVAPDSVVAQSVFDWMSQKGGGRSKDTWMEAVLSEFGWFDPTATDCGLEHMEMPEFFEGFKFMVSFMSCAFPRAHSTALQSAATLVENRAFYGTMVIFGTPEPLALFKADMSLMDQGAETPGTAFQSRRDMLKGQQLASSVSASKASSAPAVATALSNSTARVERALLKTAAIQQQSDAAGITQQHAHNQILTHNARGLDKQRMIDTAIAVLSSCPSDSDLAKKATLQLEKFFDEAGAAGGAELADPPRPVSPERILISSSPSLSPFSSALSLRTGKGPSSILGSPPPKVSQETEFTMDLQGLVGSASMGVVSFGQTNVRKGGSCGGGAAAGPKPRKQKARARSPNKGSSAEKPPAKILSADGVAKSSTSAAKKLDLSDAAQEQVQSALGSGARTIVPAGQVSLFNNVSSSLHALEIRCSLHARYMLVRCSLDARYMLRCSSAARGAHSRTCAAKYLDTALAGPASAPVGSIDTRACGAGISLQRPCLW
jgi:hypothetical protein